MKRIVSSGGIHYIRPEAIAYLKSNGTENSKMGINGMLVDVDLPIDTLAEQLGFVQPKEANKPEQKAMQFPSFWRCPSCGGMISDEDYQVRVKSQSNLFDTNPLNLCAMCRTPLSQFLEIK